MNNLTQTQIDAKQSYLNAQSEQMLDQYKNADATERGAIFKHINSFLPVIPNDAKIFWLNFRDRISDEKFSVKKL